MTIEADFAPVQIGTFSIDGLMSETGDFGVAVPQVADYFQFAKNQASRTLKPLLGNGFQFDKWKSPLNPKPVNVLTIEQLERVVFELALKGNVEAINISRALIGLSLRQLFCDAFGVKFEAEDRQNWLLKRMATRKEFRPLTDQLKAFGFTEPSQYAKFVYLFQKKLGIPSGTRDVQSLEVLTALQSAQVRLTTFMECGLSPWQALEKLS